MGTEQSLLAGGDTNEQIDWLSQESPCVHAGECQILNILPTLEPTLNLSSFSVRPPRLCGSFPSEIPATGAALKAVEDQLDSLICAYVAAHWWYWGIERNWVLGDAATGYIVVPAPFDSGAIHLKTQNSTGASVAK